MHIPDLIVKLYVLLVFNRSYPSYDEQTYISSCKSNGKGKQFEQIEYNFLRICRYLQWYVIFTELIHFPLCKGKYPLKKHVTTYNFRIELEVYTWQVCSCIIFRYTYVVTWVYGHSIIIESKLPKIVSVVI